MDISHTHAVRRPPSENNMDEVIKERQKRLAALRESAAAGTGANNIHGDIKGSAPPGLAISTIIQDINRAPLKTAEEEAEIILQEALQKHQQAEAELDGETKSQAPALTIKELAPRKGHEVDLKMGIERRLEILEERTQAAIIELVRRKIASGSGDSQLNQPDNNK